MQIHIFKGWASFYYVGQILVTRMVHWWLFRGGTPLKISILLDPLKLSLEADPLSKWGGPPLEFINIHPPKGVRLQNSSAKGCPPPSSFHQPKRDLINQKGGPPLGTISMDLAVPTYLLWFARNFMRFRKCFCFVKILGKQLNWRQEGQLILFYVGTWKRKLERVHVFKIMILLQLKNKIRKTRQKKLSVSKAAQWMKQFAE